MANRLVLRVNSIGSVRDRLTNMRGTEVGYLKEHHGKDKYDNGYTVAENAATHNFGTKHLPARPFMENAVMSVDEQEFVSNLREAINGSTDVAEAELRLGSYMESQIQKSISDGRYAALKPETIKAKGSSKPLIDTGKLRSSVSSRRKR